jgi:hypothetical protein
MFAPNTVCPVIRTAKIFLIYLIFTSTCTIHASLHKLARKTNEYGPTKKNQMETGRKGLPALQKSTWANSVN